ncbi:hypothetical protein DPMN_113153 [Dreissena polymorpha]|uniref:Uncharacterized protein n=1 Tax=Dreissena polymorpha TaxID=45954 RepID=A0A9D4KH03_DREPO|nr:hypothetical protein DPMN_113153 [Dreissena polymorpha]
MVIDEGKEGGDNQRVIDLSRGPPAYEGDKKFIMQLKKDLGLVFLFMPPFEEERVYCFAVGWSVHRMVSG